MVPVSPEVMLEARGLTKCHNSITGVRDVNFRIEHGSVLGLLGPNGSEESTTVGMLTGLLEPSGGSVELDGVNVRSDMLRYKSRLGVVALAFAVWLTRKIRLRDVEEISFEVEPLDEMCRGFNLTETYAAQSVAPRADGAAKFPV